MAREVTTAAARRGGFALLPGVPTRVHHPGFFQGLGGIGYQYLRLDAPDRFPSILTWNQS
ncbi:MAG: lanthionine synthetase LanC family protein [Rhodothermales bacterium]